MIKKFSNGQLALILGILLVAFAISRYVSNKNGGNTFHTALIPKIDSAKINGMLVYPKTKGSKLISFKKVNNVWMVSEGDVTSRADQKAEGYIIKQLQQISPDRLAANDEQHWKDFDVTDSSGTRLVLLTDKDTVVDVMVGRFNYLPNERKGMTSVRLRNQKEVYGVEGFLAMNIAEDFKSWRDRSLVTGDKTTWGKLTFMYPDSGYIVAADKTDWIVDGKKPDSLATMTLLTTLSQQNYGTFVNKFDTNATKPIYSLKIESATTGNIVLNAYQHDSSYVVTSSINPGAYMNGTVGGLFKNIFISKSVFFHHAASPKQAGKAGKK
ncbi:MAG TPA: DUF4340 domain-containing protein [Bacteroidia bacterium]|jgi:hypothetical protein|nr:DUF4340 domain-containing protein [Bacteroidia bacterium]